MEHGRNIGGKAHSDIELSSFGLQRDENEASIKLDKETLQKKMKRSAEVNPLNGATTNGKKQKGGGDGLHRDMLEVEWYGYTFMQIARAPIIAAIIVTAPIVLSQAERADTFPVTKHSTFNASTNITNATTVPGKGGKLLLAPGTISSLFSSFQSVLVGKFLHWSFYSSRLHLSHTSFSSALSLCT